MEKVVYALWRRADQTRDVLNACLKAQAVPALLALSNVRGLRFNFQDDDVARAEPLRLTGSEPAIDVAVQLWMDTIDATSRTPVATILRAECGRIGAWYVAESIVLANTAHPARNGARTAGWSQFCFLRRPGQLAHEQWRHNWQVLHTPVALSTQSSFEYVQNLVVCPLIGGSPDYAAIVEECFPTAAMDDPRVFFDSIDDDARHDANRQAMIASCARFIEMPGGIDVLPTSQYQYRAP